MGDLVDRVLTAARVRRIAIVVLVVNVVLYAVVIARGHFPFDALGTAVLPDLVAHLTGGALVAFRQIGSLYDVRAQQAWQLGVMGDPHFLDLYISPPLAALLYLPIALQPYAVAATVWTVVTLALLGLSARTIRALMPTTPRDDASLLLLVALASQPVIQLLGSGQDSALSLAIWSGGVALAMGRRDVAAGLVMSLGLFKPQLFVLPPLVFLAMRRWRAALAWAAGAAAQVALTFAIFGAPVVRAWIAILRSPEYLAFLRGERGVRMSSVLPLVETIAPDAWRGAASVVGIAVSVAIAAVALARIARASSRGTLDERGAWALACTTALLVTPHLFDYDLTLLALPVALVVEAKGGLGKVEKAALAALYALTWTVAARAGMEGAGWPIRVLAASWAAVPVLAFWGKARVERAEGVE